MFLRAWKNFISFWEMSARAKAAHQLWNMGYHEEAKNLMIKERH
jgi:hypothetical protein